MIKLLAWQSGCVGAGDTGVAYELEIRRIEKLADILRRLRLAPALTFKVVCCLEATELDDRKTHWTFDCVVVVRRWSIVYTARLC